MANVPAAVVRDAKRKAAELEKFDYKRRKDTSVDFLQRFKALPLKSFTTAADKKHAIMKLLQQ